MLRKSFSMQELSDIQDFRECRSWPRSQGHRLFLHFRVLWMMQSPWCRWIKLELVKQSMT